MSFVKGASPSSLYDLQTKAEGFISQSHSRQLLSGASSPSSGTLAGSLVGLVSGSTISNISLINVAANTATLFKVALYDLAGNRLAVSTDQKALFTGALIVTVPLITPYVVPVTGGYYAALVVTTGGTSPSIGRANATVNAYPLGSNARPQFIQTGQSDAPISATFATTTNAYWFGLS